MKTIKTLVEIPAWVKWQAQDEDGRRFGYEYKPVQEHGKRWFLDGRSLRIGLGTPNPNWKDTLQRVYEYKEVE